MRLSEAVGELELDLAKFKVVMCRDFEALLRNQTGRGEELKVGNLDAYSWKKGAPFMSITLKHSILGYIFPFQRVAFLFQNTAGSLIEPLSMALLNEGYTPRNMNVWKGAYSIVQHETEFDFTQV